MKGEKVRQAIFLINLKTQDNEEVRLQIEELTNCKVYSFISFEEAALYQALNPSLIIYSSKRTFDLENFSFKRNVKVLDLSILTIQDGKQHLKKHSNLNELLSQL